ncbi:aminodeoxychorismate/anthranilate synthase component II [bacterium]|nr:aminodeoxychorismate/anthranilate synthase component II [bacterium]
MILMIDNYDSFTYNLVQYLGELGGTVKVVRNDEIDLPGIARLKPERIVVSPGPCTPKEAGISVSAIKTFAGRLPILGVCLGHQAIAEAFGGKVVRAQRLMHGKTSQVKHDGKGVFAGVKNPFTATRYHSLIVSPDKFPRTLLVTARTAEKEIMGIRHKSLPTVGVQFHPESILTGAGKQILKNFLKMKTPK